jgi:hypothetical protein
MIQKHIFSCISNLSHCGETFFHVFPVYFTVGKHVFSCIHSLSHCGFMKSVQSGYSLDAEFNYASNELLHLKFE